MTKKILAALMIVLAMAVVGGADEPPDFTEIVKQIAQKLGGDDLYARGEAARMLEGLSVHASRPGAEVERASLCRAMSRALGPDTLCSETVIGCFVKPSLEKALGSCSGEFREESSRKNSPTLHCLCQGGCAGSIATDRNVYATGCL